LDSHECVTLNAGDILLVLDVGRESYSSSESEPIKFLCKAGIRLAWQTSFRRDCTLL